MVEGDGFEPPNPKGADLQSAAFGHFATPPEGDPFWDFPFLSRLALNKKEKCRPEDLNPQPTDYKSVALPIELDRHFVNLTMEDDGLEPPTPCL